MQNNHFTKPRPRSRKKRNGVYSPVGSKKVNIINAQKAKNDKSGDCCKEAVQSEEKGKWQRWQADKTELASRPVKKYKE